MFDIERKYTDFGSFYISEHGAFDYDGHTYIIGGSINKYDLLNKRIDELVNDELEIDDETGKVSKDQVIILLETCLKYDIDNEKYLITYKYFILYKDTILATGYVDKPFRHSMTIFNSAAEVIRRKIDYNDYQLYE